MGVCGSVKLGGKNPKRVWWSDEIKGAVRRKEEAWKREREGRESE